MPARKRLSCLILAAGLSRRAAPHNKLLLPWGETRRPGALVCAEPETTGDVAQRAGTSRSTHSGQTVVHATVNAFLEACVGEVVVVTGHERERVEAALEGLPVRFVFAENFADGMGSSLATGIRSFAANVGGFLVSPADLPELTPELIRRVAAAFHASRGKRHIVPTHADQRGHPVALGAWLRPQLETLAGDIGARSLLASDIERARTDLLPVGNAAIFRDVDSGELAKPAAQCFDTSRQT